MGSDAVEQLHIKKRTPRVVSHESVISESRRFTIAHEGSEESSALTEVGFYD